MTNEAFRPKILDLPPSRVVLGRWVFTDLDEVKTEMAGWDGWGIPDLLREFDRRMLHEHQFQFCFHCVEDGHSTADHWRQLYRWVCSCDFCEEFGHMTILPRDIIQQRLDKYYTNQGGNHPEL